MIHYHGTPCGGTREEAARFLSGRHALIPWIRSEDIGCAADVCQSFCLDNGAYTAWQQGKPIENWEPYFEWVRFWCRHPAFDFAIIPDVIDGTEDANDRLIAEWVNWPQWHRKGDVAGHPGWTTQFRSFGVPVWHVHESFERLQKLCRHWPRVALGSSGQWADPGSESWWRRIAEAMEWACVDGQPIAKLHGLRMLDPAIFHRLPLASADSTNAVRNSSNLSRFGQYTPPTSGQRSNTIADRTERHQSAAVWVPPQAQPMLAFMGGEDSP